MDMSCFKPWLLHRNIPGKGILDWNEIQIGKRICFSQDYLVVVLISVSLKLSERYGLKPFLAKMYQAMHETKPLF